MPNVIRPASKAQTKKPGLVNPISFIFFLSIPSPCDSDVRLPGELPKVSFVSAYDPLLQLNGRHPAGQVFRDLKVRVLSFDRSSAKDYLVSWIS